MKHKTHALVLVALLVCGLRPHTASAHKFHESLSQVEYNAETRSAEITVRMFPDDLEEMLSRRSGKHVRLDKTPDAGALTLAYLRDSFELKNRGGELKALEWVGMEVQVDSVWAYIEVKMPEGLAGAQVRDRIFFELFDDQINRVSVKYGAGKSDMVFKPGDGFKNISDRQSRD